MKRLVHEYTLMLLSTITQYTYLGCVDVELAKEIFSFVDTLLLILLEDTKTLGPSCWSEDCFPPLHLLDCAALLAFAETP